MSGDPAGGQAEKNADILICGGGISGLSLAAWLARAGLDADVLDRNAEPGGVIGTLHKDGFLFERGPNTVLDKHESLDELIGWAGLDGEVIREPLARQRRYVWLRGALREVPTSPAAFLATPLLPWKEKLALFAEPFRPLRPEDESVAAFVRRRLGPAWVRNLITPMVSGVWAGDPERLSIEHAFPIMKEMERDGGSILRGALRLMRRRAAERKAAGKPRRVRHLVSFRDGLQRLPQALAGRIGPRYHRATNIVSIAETAAGFEVLAERAGEVTRWRTRRLVIAAESDRAAGWLAPVDAELASVLEEFPYNRLAVVALGIERAEARLPEGFGFLVPRGEGLRILGAIVNSNFLPGRAPEGCAALAIFIGGALEPAAVELAAQGRIDIVGGAHGRAVGWSGRYRSIHIERWPRAIPQYDLAHGLRMERIEAAERRHPGLHLLGNWRGGVSIGDRVETTRSLADQLAAARAR